MTVASGQESMPASGSEAIKSSTRDPFSAQSEQDSKPRGLCLLHGHVTSSGWACDLVWPRKLMRKIYSPLCLFLSHQIREREPTAHADASLRMGVASWKAEKVNKGTWSLTEWLSC